MKTQVFLLMSQNQCVSCFQYLPVFVVLTSQCSRLQLADEQQAMNHWVFFPHFSVLNHTVNTAVSAKAFSTHSCEWSKCHSLPVWRFIHLWLWNLFKADTWSLLLFPAFLWRWSITKHPCSEAFHAASCSSAFKLVLYSIVTLKAPAKRVLKRAKSTVISVEHSHTVITGCVSRFATCVSTG